MSEESTATLPHRFLDASGKWVSEISKNQKLKIPVSLKGNPSELSDSHENTHLRERRLDRKNRLPSSVFMMNDKERKDTLEFYLSRYGSVTDGVITVGTQHRKIVYGLYQLLLSFGAVSKIESSGEGRWKLIVGVDPRSESNIHKTESDSVEYSEISPLEEDTYVYDLMVPDTHNYVVDGKWSHNTYMVLTSTELQINRGAVGKGKTLIAAKLATLETGWLQDSEMFTDLKVGVLWSSKSKKEKKYEEIMGKLNDSSYDAYVINHDGIRVYEKELTDYGFEKVVVDESTILKGFHGMGRHFKGGEFGRSLMRVAQNAKWRAIMTGTPAPNGPQDLWGQFKFLNPEGFIIEPTWRDYMSSYFKQVYFGATNVRNTGQVFKSGPKKGSLKFPNTPMNQLIAPHLKEGDPLNKNTPSKWVVKSTAIRTISELISPWIYRLKLRDCVEVPKDYRMNRLVDMTRVQAQHYKDMKESLVVELGDKEIRAAIELAAYGKLRQITAGFIIDHEGEAIALRKNPKMDMLDQMVHDEIDVEEKIVIFCEFQWEIKTITSRYKKYGAVSVYGGNAAKKNLENIKKFKAGGKDVRIIVMHPQSAAHGVNLTEACYLIFFSINFSAEFNYQAVGRILRANQKKPMFIYYLLCRNSIDTLAYDKIIKKNSDQEALMVENEQSAAEEILQELRGKT